MHHELDQLYLRALIAYITKNNEECTKIIIDFQDIIPKVSYDERIEIEITIKSLKEVSN